MREIRKILIIRLSSIGDIVLATPLVRDLRNAFPESAIDFAVKEEYVDLISTNPHISNVLAYEKHTGYRGLRKFKRLIRYGRYNIILDIHKNLRSVYLRTGSGADKVFTHKKHLLKRFVLVNFGINLYRNPQPVNKRYYYAVRKLNIQQGNAVTELYVPDKIFDYMKKIFLGSGLRQNQKIVTLCPGAGFKNKCWLPEGFASVGDYFAEKHNAFIVILGGEGDEEVCGKVKSLMRSHSVDFCSRTTLLQAAAAVKLSSLVISNDSGLMHIAQTQKKPVLAIFGPTVRELGYFPLPVNSFVIEKELSCRPCTKNGLDHCPKKHFKCMRDITDKEVIKAAEQLFLSHISAAQEHHGQNLVSSL
ncbi:glycosyltransferase family 9 protein [candidate division KSB1 bacterium]